MSRGRHGFYAVPENGPAARSLVADAHHCIMVQAHPRPTEYKCVGRHRPEDELPLDHPTRFRSAPSRRPTTNRQSEGLTTITPYKPAPAKAGGAFLLIDPKPQTAFQKPRRRRHDPLPGCLRAHVDVTVVGPRVRPSAGPRTGATAEVVAAAFEFLVEIVQQQIGQQQIGQQRRQRTASAPALRLVPVAPPCQLAAPRALSPRVCRAGSAVAQRCLQGPSKRSSCSPLPCCCHRVALVCSPAFARAGSWLRDSALRAGPAGRRYDGLG